MQKLKWLWGLIAFFVATIDNIRQTTAEYFCAFCGEPNTTFVDISAGMQQSYLEDCQVCCRPNILFIRVDEHTLDVEIETDYEEG